MAHPRPRHRPGALVVVVRGGNERMGESANGRISESADERMSEWADERMGGLKHSLAGRHGSGPPWVQAGGVVQGAGQGFEQGFGLVMVVAAIEHVCV